MITRDEDCDKANIVLIIDNQRGLQALFEYIIYLGIKVNISLHRSPQSRFFLSRMKFYLISFNRIVFILIQVCQQLVPIY